MARVIVVTGTLGAGKTFTAEAVHDAIVGRGQRCAVIDVDWLCQNEPTPADDPFNDRLAFANLAAVWPNYDARGIDYLIVARVMGDPDDRDKYAAALPGCEIRVVRVEASAATCARRLTSRMPEAPWRDRHLARTDALAERLRSLALEDVVVVNEDGPAAALADAVLSRLGW